MSIQGRFISIYIPTKRWPNQWTPQIDEAILQLHCGTSCHFVKTSGHVLQSLQVDHLIVMHSIFLHKINVYLLWSYMYFQQQLLHYIFLSLRHLLRSIVLSSTKWQQENRIANFPVDAIFNITEIGAKKLSVRKCIAVNIRGTCSGCRNMTIRT